MPLQQLYKRIVPDNSPDRFKVMYLMLAAVCLGIILIVSALVIRWNSSTDLKDTAIANSERIVDSIYYTEVDAILVDNDSSPPTIHLAASARDTLDIKLRDMYDPLNIVKVLIYNHAGAIIYGNERYVPDDPDRERHIDKVLKTGKIIYELHKDMTIIDLVGEKRENADLAEVYVPIRNKEGQLIGVFEVYSDVSRLTHKYTRQMISAIMAQTFMLLVLSLISYFIIIRESSELKLAYQKLEAMATTDPLTGISNRRQLLDRVEQHFAMMQRTGEGMVSNVGLGFIMLDVDYFKQVNDSFGHLAGDHILQELATVINQVLRPYDVFGRYGGEEFLVVLPSTLAEETARIAERLITTVREHVYLWNGRRITITLSAGVTWTDASRETLDEILIKVDRHLYAAKQQGRNQVVADT